MIELAQHIEALLLENDCVIVPGLGGFVGHYTPAVRLAEENRFLPPARVIGFNPSLKMNDGLLVQSYASVYGTSFSDATRRIEHQVCRLQNKLYEEGKVELANIGELRCSVYGALSFVPFDSKLTTPYLYGWQGFEMRELQAMPQQRTAAAGADRSVAPIHRRRRNFRMQGAVIRHAMSAVAAVLLFFLLSTPIENTGMMEENYARLMPSELFSQMGHPSLVVTPVGLDVPAVAQQQPKKKVTVPVAVKEVKVKAAATAKSMPAEKTVKAAPAEKAVNAVPTEKAVQDKKAVSAAKDIKAVLAEKTAKAVPAEKAGQTAKVIPAEKLVPAAKVAKPYHIIVASVGSEQDAHRMAEQLKQKGFSKACAVIGNGKMRVSIQACSSEAEAYKALKEIRAIEAYQSAWVLH